MRVGVVGAGRMGRPMVDRVRAAGHDVIVLARTEERRATLAASGITTSGSLAEVAHGADVVLVCVFTDEQVREVCIEGDLVRMLPDDSALVLHTTGSPRTAEEIAARNSSVHVLDCPVSGGPHDIAAGGITLFAGGDAAAMAKARPVLETYGDPILHTGRLGAGQRVKMINNALFAAHIGLLTEAVRLGTDLGVDEEVLLRAISHGSGASRPVGGALARGSVAGFAASAGEFIAKDVAVAREVAAELGPGLGLLDEAISAWR